MRKLRGLNIALLAGLLVGALLAWPSLPGRIPTHFDARGVPDAWRDKSFSSWFLLPIIGAATVALMYVSMWAVQRRPEFLNIPQKKEFLELGAEDRAPVLREVVGLLELVTLVVLLMFGAIQLAMYRAALGLAVRELMLAVLVIAMAGMPLLIIVMVLRIQAAVRDARRTAQRHGRL